MPGMAPPSALRRNRNPGHSALRQKAAPQPDQGFTTGERPMDRMRQNIPGQPVRNFPQQRPGGQQGGGKNLYLDFLDRLNPNGNQPVHHGLSDQQVMWMKRNLLGRQGQVGGREGQRFQNQMSRYIGNQGGVQAFGQQMGAQQRFQGRGMTPGGTATNRQGLGRGPQGQPGQHSGGIGMTVPPGGPSWQGPGYQPGPEDRGPQGQPPGPQSRLMFPQQAAQFNGPQQPMPGQMPGQNQGQQAPQPMQGMAGQSPNQGGQPQGQNGRQNQGQGQQGAPGAGRGTGQAANPRPQSIEEQAAELVSNPVVRTTAAHYKGETNPDAQRKQDRERFGRRGIPLTPETEEAMRQITQQYIDGLIQQGYAEADAAAYVDMAKERLAARFSQDQGQLDETAAAAGHLNSGVRLDQQAQLGQQYGREAQDIALAGAQNERDLANQRAALETWYRVTAPGEIALRGTQQAVENAMSGDNFSGLRTGKRRNRSGNRRGKKRAA